MKLVIASDHAGFALKEELKKYLTQSAVELTDLGTASPESVDYPDFAHQLADEVSRGNFAKGILVCGSGIGMAMAANRHPKVRAVVVRDEFDAEMSRQHNDANVICLGGRVTEPALAKKLLQIWLDTPFAGGRHQKRVSLIES